jgi:aerobic carbon-monoxide dehydrogenase medium subunit
MIKDFEYFVPGTLKEAITLLDKYQDEAKVIAGGQSLLILMRQGLVAPQYLVDIKGLSSLNTIRIDDRGALTIGALTTHRAIEKSPLLRNAFAVLAEMERHVATIQTRNWGTIGGNVCHGDPAGDPTPVLIALNAIMRLVGPNGEREVAAEDFNVDFFETVLEPGELLTEIRIPKCPPRTGTYYSKFTVIENELGVVTAAVSITLRSGNDVCADARIALGASAPTAIRARKAETVLNGQKISGGLLREAGEVASSEAQPFSDICASAEYRRELVKVMVTRVGQEALARAKCC